MNRSLILPLIICGLMLAGCYRQAGESFEQVNSQSVDAIQSPTPNTEPSATEIEEDTTALEADETTDSNITPSKTPDPDDVNPTEEPESSPTGITPPTEGAPVVPTATVISVPTATATFTTPESAPGQTTPATINPPTPTPTISFIQPSATAIGEGIQAGDECVHEVTAGDTLFRLAINNGTTVEAIQEVNSLPGDAIQIGQLLVIPECVAGQTSEPTATTSSATSRPTVTSSAGGSSVATLESTTTLPTSGQQIHVVVSGETLGAIANRYGTSISEIAELNDLTDPNALQIGDELLIPASN